MIQRTPWIERRFNFDFPTGCLYNILERLRGSSVRITDMVCGMDDEVLIFKPSGKWSIKEHVGHLLELEHLHRHRIGQLAQKVDVLTPADMSNQKTEESDFNKIDLKQLITNFDQQRQLFISEILDLPEDILQHSALHERLNVKMRPIDVAYFTAEHDDHHLADIRNLVST